MEDLYGNDTEGDSVDHAEILLRMDKLDKNLRKLRNKSKEVKRKKRKSPKNTWWQAAIVNSLPNAIDFAKVLFRK